MRPVVYVAGPYRVGDREENIAAADAAGREVFARGYAPLVPHNNTARWDELLGDACMDVCLALVSKADALCVIGHWTTSPGTLMEIVAATARGIPVYFGLESLPPIERWNGGACEPPREYDRREGGGRGPGDIREREPVPASEPG